MDRQPLTLRMFDVSAPYRGAERNEHPNIGETRNVTEHEPNIPNITVPLATFRKLKGRLREALSNLGTVEKENEQLKQVVVFLAEELEKERARNGE